MKQNDCLEPTDKVENVSQGRRTALKKILTGGGIVAGSFAFPSKWISPVVDWIIIPAHAQTSPTTTTTSSQVTWAIIDCASVQTGFVDGNGLEASRLCGTGTRIENPLMFEGNISWGPPMADPSGILLRVRLTQPSSPTNLLDETVLVDSNGDFQIINIMANLNVNGEDYGIAYEVSFEDTARFGNTICTGLPACSSS